MWLKSCPADAAGFDVIGDASQERMIERGAEPFAPACLFPYRGCEFVAIHYCESLDSYFKDPKQEHSNIPQAANRSTMC